jgi:hypothetical protein
MNILEPKQLCLPYGIIPLGIHADNLKENNVLISCCEGKLARMSF